MVWLFYIFLSFFVLDSKKKLVPVNIDHLKQILFQRKIQEGAFKMDKIRLFH